MPPFISSNSSNKQPPPILALQAQKKGPQTGPEIRSLALVAVKAVNPGKMRVDRVFYILDANMNLMLAITAVRKDGRD